MDLRESQLLTRKNDGSLCDLSAASRTSSGSAQDVFRAFRIATGKFIENAIEGYLRAVTALVATTDHALCCGSKIFTNQMDCHVFQRWIEILGPGRVFSGIHVASEGDQSIIVNCIEAARTSYRFRQGGFGGPGFRRGFVQQAVEWRDCEAVTFLAGNQPVLRF
ncbi:MAG TPA: hypothetical protein VFO86_04100 [Terriglobia bacterium]|nr:hypothetical protein [Terriglobia bacterium]